MISRVQKSTYVCKKASSCVPAWGISRLHLHTAAALSVQVMRELFFAILASLGPTVDPHAYASESRQSADFASMWHNIQEFVVMRASMAKGGTTCLTYVGRFLGTHRIPGNESRPCHAPTSARSMPPRAPMQSGSFLARNANNKHAQATPRLPSPLSPARSPWCRLLAPQC